MLIIIIMIMAIMLVPIPANADDNTEELALLISLAAADYQQSVVMFYHSDGYHEINPILGTNPSRTNMLAFGAIGVGLTYLVADTLPKPWRQILLDSVIASEKMNIEENSRAYSGLNINGPPVRGREINGIPIVISLRF
jgi:hypothetical protein